MKVYIILFMHIVSSVIFAQDGLNILEKNSYYGIYIKELASSNEIVSINKSKNFSPASVTKLITTATALEMLGSDFRYETNVQYCGNINNGVLNGDLIIKGSGDPTLGSRKFNEDTDAFIDKWANDIVKFGIKKIDGSIISDASVFDNQAIPDKWIWEDIGNYYGAGVYGLSCFDNMYELYFASTKVGEVAKVEKTVPVMPKVSFESQVLAANIKYDNAYIYGSPWCYDRIIRGEIPANCQSFMIKGSMPNPPLYLADLLKKKLIEKGIIVTAESKVQWQKQISDAKLVSKTFSPTLAEIVKITNKESNNLYAEHLLKALAMKHKTSSSTKDGLSILADFWVKKGISAKNINLYDGSGLSRANLFTPEFIVSVIEYMNKSENSEAFFNSLAISGVDGTLKYFLKGTDLTSKVHGKSGSMSGVRCYAGIIEIKAKKYSFCIMVNNFTCSQTEVRKAVEAYLLYLFD